MRLLEWPIHLGPGLGEENRRLRGEIVAHDADTVTIARTPGAVSTVNVRPTAFSFGHHRCAAHSLMIATAGADSSSAYRECAAGDQAECPCTLK